MMIPTLGNISTLSYGQIMSLYLAVLKPHWEGVNLGLCIEMASSDKPCNAQLLDIIDL